MSAIDTSLSESERARLLAEVREHLPAFLSSATTERPDPVGDVRALLNLSSRDLSKVVAVHVLLTKEVREFVAALPGALRQPATETTRREERSRFVRGGVDWARTTRLRFATGGAEELYVLRPAQRQFDTPENRVLAYTIDYLLAELSLVLPDRHDGSEQAETPGRNWHGELRAAKQVLARARRVAWLRSVPPERPAAEAKRRLNASRIGFYRNTLTGCLAVIARYAEQPSEDDLVDLLTQRYFEPTRDWQLYEVVIALRLARAFAQHSDQPRKSRLLVGTSKAPFARYRLADGNEVRLWYQAWPSAMSVSEHRDVRQRYEIASSDLRPDLVLEVKSADSTSRCVVIECKASTSSRYLSQGVFQLLGYIKDRPHALDSIAPGWLVAPRSDAYQTADPGELEVRALSDEDVAAAAVERFVPSATSATQ